MPCRGRYVDAALVYHFTVYSHRKSKKARKLNTAKEQRGALARKTLSHCKKMPPKKCSTPTVAWAHKITRPFGRFFYDESLDNTESVHAERSMRLWTDIEVLSKTFFQRDLFMVVRISRRFGETTVCVQDIY